MREILPNGSKPPGFLGAAVDFVSGLIDQFQRSLEAIFRLESLSPLLLLRAKQLAFSSGAKPPCPVHSKNGRSKRRLRAGWVTFAELKPEDQKFMGEVNASLRAMRCEVEGLLDQLPEDARPMGQAARLIVEDSLVDCQEANFDALKLADDMQQVWELAAAMRIRLLLSPQGGPEGLPN